MTVTDPRCQVISDAIRVIPDFPVKGIMFQDVTTVLLNPEAFRHSIDLLVERYRDMKVDVVAGGWATGCRQPTAANRATQG